MSYASGILSKKIGRGSGAEDMKKVLILHTGGTIGMMPTEKGYAPVKGYFEKAIEEIRDLRAPEMPDWDFMEMEVLLDSSNITVKEWNEIGGVIFEKYDEYDGFVVLHGTDTMAYTASALSFMLENLNKPVVLTGAQIPLCCVRSDARDNLITSLTIAADGVANEVCLYFGGKLHRGNRATKFSADRLIAFESFNAPYLAEADVNIKYNLHALRPYRPGKLNLRELDRIPIGVIKIFPGIQLELFESMMTECLKGVVVETFGAGNIPGGGDKLIPIIRKALANGTVITVCSQCPQGSVSLGTYETSTGLKNAGAVCGWDMTTEAAVAKLYYLFSCGYDADTVKMKMEENIAGELTVR